MGVLLHHGPPLPSHLRVHLSFALSGLSAMTTALQQGKRYHVFCCACKSYFRNTVSQHFDCPLNFHMQHDFLYRNKFMNALSA